MSLLAILNRLNIFSGISSCLQLIEFPGRWSFCNMKRNNKCYWYVKSCYLTIYWQVFVLYFNPTIFHNLEKHYCKITSQGNGKFVAYTTCLKCHVHKKLSGLRRVYEEISSLVFIINLLITPVGNVLIRLASQGKGNEDLNRQWLFSNLETSIPKAIIAPGNFLILILIS